MQKRTMVLSVIYAAILIVIMFASITDLKVALLVNASIAAGALLTFLRYRWVKKRVAQRRQYREEHKKRFNFRPGSRHFDSIRTL